MSKQLYVNASSVLFGSLRCEQLFLSLRAVGPPTCSVPAKTLGLFEGKLQGKYRLHTTYRTIYVMVSCNSQKETDSISIADRSSLSQKEIVYHEKTVYHGKKQSITERQSLSQKETVYNRKKMSTCLNHSYLIRKQTSTVYSNNSIVCICNLNLFVSVCCEV